MGDFLPGMFAGGLVVFVVMLSIGGCQDMRPRAAIHAEALEAGAGEYYLDEHNEKQWRWLTPATHSNTQEGE